jgi:hypothetical protein
MALSPNFLLKSVRRLRFAALIHPKANLTLRANGLPRVWQSLIAATLWRCRFRPKRSMPP